MCPRKSDPRQRAYTYDRNSNRQQLSDGAATTIYTYTELDRLKDLSRPGGAKETFTYNDAGELTTRTFPAGTTSETKTGLVDSSSGPTATQAWRVPASGSGTITASLDWAPEPKTDAFANQPIPQAPLLSSAKKTHTITVGAGGTITAGLDWVGTGDLDLALRNPAGTVVASAATSAKPETLAPYTVAAGATGTYTLEVTNYGAATTYTLTTTYPSYATLDLKLKDAAGTTVATATGTRPKSVSAAVGTAGAYSLEVTALSHKANYTLGYSYPTAGQSTWVYDLRGRPIKETTAAGETAWELDGLDRVIHRTVKNPAGTVTTDVRLGYDGPGDAPAFEMNASNVITLSYVSDASGVLAVQPVGGARNYRYHTGTGDFAQSAAADGTVASTTPAVFNEFGVAQGQAPSSASPYGYLGRQQQETTAGGTVLIGNQLYDPALGRILSRPAADPIEGVSTNIRLTMARSSRAEGLLADVKHGLTDLGTISGMAAFIVAAGGLLVGSAGCPPCAGIALAAGGASLASGATATTIECFFDGGGFDRACGAGVTTTTLSAISFGVSLPTVDLSSALKLLFSGASAAGSMVPYLPPGGATPGGPR
jgi:YD repeat-containing protein